jgi:DNA repair protein RadA/Sms
MVEGGLVDVADPSRLLLADRRPGACGSVVSPVLDGRRPLLVELQSLVIAASAGGTARRSVEGVDGSRLALLLAVLGRVMELPVLGAEVYCLAVGGVRVVDPGADLALAAAVVSSLAGRPLPDDLVICGEVGLSGEVRTVRHLDRRLAEVARSGFRRAVVPLSAPDVNGLELRRVRSVREALLAVGLADQRPSRPADGTSARLPRAVAG